MPCLASITAYLELPDSREESVQVDELLDCDLDLPCVRVLLFLCRFPPDGCGLLPGGLGAGVGFSLGAGVGVGLGTGVGFGSPGAGGGVVPASAE